ncbi:MAG: DUF2802 domain-containing protein [Candidatus Competibacteraceae bacterium]|nr:DUF2802 domain-containing protein [Candidatus Competibacteraceae bacterium]
MNDIILYAVAIAALVISNVLLVIVGIVAARLLRKPAETVVREDQEAEARQRELQRGLQELAAAVGGLNDRLGRIETQVERVQERIQNREKSASPTAINKEGDRKAFEVATKLALKGADVEELINLCGLTRGEAELIRMLHASGKGQPSSGGG